MRVKAGESPPFLMASDASVTSSGWFQEDGKPLPTLLPEWDPATNLGLYCDFQLDTAALAEDCQLGDRSKVQMGMSWTSSARVSTAVAGPTVVLDGEIHAVQLAVSVPGEQVAESLRLRTFLWIQDAEPISALSPSSEGDLIWSDLQATLLESDAARFPMTVMDFDKAIGVETEASWYVSWPTQRFNEPFAASLRLLINSGKSEIVEAIQTDSESEASDAIRRHIFIDTARTLINLGLGSEEFLDSYDEYPEGTVGSAISELIATCWGDSFSPSEVKGVRDEKPQVFEARIQAILMEGF